MKCLMCHDAKLHREAERAATLAEVCAWLRAVRENQDYWSLGPAGVDALINAIERGDTRPRGEGSQKP